MTTTLVCPTCSSRLDADDGWGSINKAWRAWTLDAVVIEAPLVPSPPRRVDAQKWARPFKVKEQFTDAEELANEIIAQFEDRADSTVLTDALGRLLGRLMWSLSEPGIEPHLASQARQLCEELAAVVKEIRKRLRGRP